VTGTYWKIYSSIWRRDSIRSAGTEEIIECVKLRLHTDSFIGVSEGRDRFCRYHSCDREVLTLRACSVFVRESSKILDMIFVACA